MGLKSKPPVNMFHVAVDLIESRPADDPLHRFAAFSLYRLMLPSQRLIMDTVARTGIVRTLPTAIDVNNTVKHLLDMGYIERTQPDHYKLTAVGAAIHGTAKVSIDGHTAWYKEDRK